ncbi:MAG: SufD family Fe-S cluster assembly protein [Ruminococcaceae bacterium]|nr:SufD family Fe-S cluster assembly protein [Oscillospiraceae bacterium]
MDNLQKNLLFNIAGINAIPEGAYNIRANGALESRKTTENIDIVTKKDKTGIDIFIKNGTKNETVHIPVIISQTGLNDLVYNDFHVGEDCDVTIVAGCGIHNCGSETSKHDGIHSFFVGKNSHLKYVEKHYGEGGKEDVAGNGENVMNPTTIINLAKGSTMEMETTQIRGIDSTDRVTTARLEDDATLIIHEKLMTHGKQYARTEFKVDLDGENSSTNVVSRSVAKDTSHQIFISKINGNNKCAGHTECDAIIMDNASVSAIPEIMANSTEASLIHEAAIGKIAGEQLIKLMTLGLTEEEAEEQIVNGFLK